jgi:5-methylcytosine-specific restriction endonuclease McrA
MPSGVYVRTVKSPFVGRPKGYVVSQETKEKIRLKLLGQKYSDERKLASGIARRGKPAWNKGKGTRTKLTQMIRSSAQYAEWRRQVFLRDNFTCAMCPKRGDVNADHIKAFSVILTEYKISRMEDALQCEEMWDIKNGRTLCLECHKKTPNFGTKARLSTPKPLQNK